MHLLRYRLKNYRRLRDVSIELAPDISVFVGANNSGKTSATQALYTFVSGARERLSLYDFHSSCWKVLDRLGEASAEDELPLEMPSISLDLWFAVVESDLYLALPLLPSLKWTGTEVGIRIEWAARNPVALVAEYQAARELTRSNAATLEVRSGDKYAPWPKSLSDYLSKLIQKEFEFKYYVLDRQQFDASFQPVEDYAPMPIDKEPGGAALLKSLIRVDNLSAQRHLADPSTKSGSGGGRAEELSRRLSRFYKRNLDQRPEDHATLRALFDSEEGLNQHLAAVFQGTLDRLSKLGYPGLNNPRMEIRSALNPATIMSSQDASVHYILGDGEDAVGLPDSYNGLGFKNLIYMVVEILDLHAQWVGNKENRAPLHLVFIEEPEAHLHTQLQQVFTRNVLALMQEEETPGSMFQSQTVVTTHSPHILYESGFKPVRYFRRGSADGEQTTEVLNLSAFYEQNPVDRDFLERYIKLTHCDLFFADAALLVEGNVERLLLPLMIEKSAPALRSSCLCILEVGGAFGHRFRSLIEFLGITTLVITDLDSVSITTEPSGDGDETTEFDIPSSGAPQKTVAKVGKICMAGETGASTSNQTLIQWLPGKLTVAELWSSSDEERIQESGGAKVCVAYQMPTEVTWNKQKKRLCGRTLEEAFGLENEKWCQEQSHLGLKLRVPPGDPEGLASGLHKKVSSKSFDKTKFALAVMMEPPGEWNVPDYIMRGLSWLEREVAFEAKGIAIDTTAATSEAESTIASIPDALT